jgi:hypothetical protein
MGQMVDCVVIVTVCDCTLTVVGDARRPEKFPEFDKLWTVCVVTCVHVTVEGDP